MPGSMAALSVYDGRSPSEPGGSEERVLVELPRPALAERDDLDSLSAADQRAYVRSLDDEGRALRWALGARGVQLRDAVTFERTWHGFAATIDAVRPRRAVEPRRRARAGARFYPATSEPVPVRGVPRPTTAAPADRQPGSRSSTPAPPRAATTRSTATATPRRAPTRARPRGARRAATRSPRSSTAAGERAMSIRVAGYGRRRAEIHGTTDTLLAGLERAVDPNGDGAVDDAVRVALVGVNAPYAGFADAPEAQAVRGAGKLGTLVVAPAGNEGPARPPNGVIGSPGAARAALTAGATEAGAGAARLDVTVGDRTLAGAAALGGTPPTGALKLAGPVDEHRHRGAARGRPSVTGRVAIVRAGDNPSAQATAAAGAGRARSCSPSPATGRCR